MEVLTTEEKMNKIGRDILVHARNELYLKMRFLDVALSSYRFVMDEGIETIGTDGLAVYFHPRYLGGIFRENERLVNRAYLHMVLHGIFRHMIRRKSRDVRYYNLACEIAVESIIDNMKYPCVVQSQSWLRREIYRKMNARMKVLTAEKIYNVLREMELSEKELLKLEEEYCVDDHRYWPQDDEKKKQEIENQWQDISERTQTDMETFSKDASEQSGHFIDQLKVENRGKMDYRDFLRKFSVYREEMMIDEDSFDYVFYSYGLRMYDNMPLIEPQEWKEVKKIEEFVIVIDTSMSCSGELVKKFLEATYTILSENDSFFRKVNIHIIQCDDTVQSDQKITDREELREYMERLDLLGEGGTDFRPAFEYVEKLRREQVFTQLRGLIYFTDGKGVYPKRMPDFETVFVFLEEDYEERQVPPWAMKLILKEEDLL